ncbi:ABC transporter permease [Actinophytocola sediminis]
MRGWLGDLALGLRLALGGGASALTRFLLSAVGIAIGVAVLLFGASIGSVVAEHEARSATDSIGADVPVDGVDPLYWAMKPTTFHGERVEFVYVYADGENYPLPNGLERLPAPGEVVASPALIDLLASPAGELLRPRVPGEITGTLGRALVTEPDDLRAYVGADPAFAESSNTQQVYEFDGVSRGSSIPPEQLLVLFVGTVLLLVPVFVFVSSSSRIAGAERDRRLAALRLVGAGSRQVRRIAAAEGVVSALAGLVLGAGVFLLARLFAEEVELFGRRVYVEDVVPDPVLTVLIVLAVPVLAVATAQFALRRTIIEPLGVVRHVWPVRRRGWWRLGLVAVGVALLIVGGDAGYGPDLGPLAIATGAMLLVVGVPVLLPWLLELAVRRIRGGPTSWQLAIRRLQLDTGTPARVVGGISVVLAGAIALQAILLTTEGDVRVSGDARPRDPMIEVRIEESSMARDVAADLAAVPRVAGTHVLGELAAYAPGTADGQSHPLLSVMDCAAVRALAGAADCTDGDAFAWPGAIRETPAPGTVLEFRDYGPSSMTGELGDHEVTDTWTVPAVTELPANSSPDRTGSMIVTPGALAGLALPEHRTTVRVDIDRPSADDLESVRNAVSSYTWRTHVFVFPPGQYSGGNEQTFVTIRNGLYAGSVFTLLLAGVSLLVLALEHLRERRRPLAVLVATGVPRGVLARSLLWQVVLPIVLGVVTAVVTGLGLAWLVLRATTGGLTVDWLGVGLLSAGAVLVAVLMTALTLPFLRGATRLSALRTE